METLTYVLLITIALFLILLILAARNVSKVSKKNLTLSIVGRDFLIEPIRPFPPDPPFRPESPTRFEPPHRLDPLEDFRDLADIIIPKGRRKRQTSMRTISRRLGLVNTRKKRTHRRARSILQGLGIHVRLTSNSKRVVVVR